MLAKKKMGCSDTGPPESATELQLSRIHETYHYLQKYFGHATARDFWQALPNHVRAEYNYANWTYRPTGEFNWKE